MNICVVDASVAVKWVLSGADEPYGDEAAELLRRSLTGNVTLVVPDLFWPELGNILWKAVRRSRLQAGLEFEALAEIRRLDMQTVPTEPFIEKALEIAATNNRSVYDSLYVACAMAQKAQMITADERLVNALGARFPVRWLGGYLH